MPIQELSTEPLTFSGAVEVLRESVGGMVGGFVAHLPNLGLASVVLLATWAVAWGVDRVYWRLMGGRHLRPSLNELVVRLLTVGAWLMGLLAANVFERGLEGASSVSQDREFLVNATGCAASSIDFDITRWAGSSPAEVRRPTDEVVRRNKQGLDEAGLGIPFPQRTLHLAAPVEVESSAADTRVPTPSETH